MATAVSEAVAVRTRTRVPLPPKLRAPGWYRAALFSVLGDALIGLGLGWCVALVLFVCALLLIQLGV